MGFDLLHSPTVVSGLIFASFVALAIFLRNRQEEARHRRNGFAPPVQYRSLDPFMGLDFVIKVFLDISHTQRNRLRYGKTFLLKPLLAGPMIVTADPENLPKVFGSADGDYQVYWRKDALVPFTGQGILTEDGDGWRVSRRLLRPSFAKTKLANFEFYSRVVDELIEKIPGRGETVDLHPLLLKGVSL